jgi:hypothetical protein
MRRSTRRPSLKSGSPVLTGSSVLPETMSPAKPPALSKSSTGKSRKKQQTASPLLPASEAVGDEQINMERLVPKALEGPHKDEPRTKAADKDADLTSKKKNTKTNNAVVLSDQGDEDSNDARSDDACARTASEDEERLEDGTAESQGTETALVTPLRPSSAPSRRRRDLRPTVSSIF